MRCSNPDCTCMTHVDPSTHVPCCQICHTPLAPCEDDPELGVCLHMRSPVPWRCVSYGRAITPDEWLWLSKDIFMGSDLPPANGWQPITIREEDPS